MLRYYLTALVLFLYSLVLPGQQGKPTLYPSILVGDYDCDRIILTAINAVGAKIAWLAGEDTIPGATEEVLQYTGPIDDVVFTLAIRRAGEFGSDTERIRVQGGCPREECDNGIDDDGDGLADLFDTEDCSCGQIPLRTEGSLIPNGSFERRREISPECDGCYIAYWQLDCVEDWEASNYNSSIEHILKCYANGISSAFVNYTLDNNASFLGARMTYDSTGATNQETARVALSSPTIPGERYRYALKIDIAGGTVKNTTRRSQEFILYGGTGRADFPFRFRGRDVIFGGSFQDWIAIDSFSIAVTPDREWQYVSFEFVAPPEPIRYLVLGGEVVTDYPFTEGQSDYTLYYVMDDVDLRRILPPPPTLPEELVVDVAVRTVAGQGSDPSCVRNTLLTTPYFPDYTYQWYRNDLGLPGATDHEYLVEAGVGTKDAYRVRVYKDGVCQLSEPVRIESDAPFVTEVTINSLTCPGGADGRVAATFTPADLVSRYEWRQPDSTRLTGTISNGRLTVTQLTAGEYLLRVFDTNGCESSQSVTVNQPAPLYLATEVEAGDCNTTEAGTLRVTDYGGGTGPYTFSLGGATPADSIRVAYTLEPGNYVPTLVDRLGCRQSAPALTIAPPDPLRLQVTATPPQVTLGERVRLSYRANRDLTGATVTWLNLPDTSCTSCANLTFVPTVSDMLRLQVIDVDGCQTIESVSIRVRRDPQVYFPTAISPNGDGVNEAFEAFPGVGIAAVETLEVYSRWGQLLFAGTAQGMRWDGRTPSGQPMNDGVYIYRSTLRLIDGTTVFREGSFTLVR